MRRRLRSSRRTRCAISAPLAVGGRIRRSCRRSDRTTSAWLDPSATQVTARAIERGTNGHLAALENLADMAAGAGRATRVVTDQGWLARDAQIGQTTVTIAPRLAAAAGVSGSVHHSGAIRTSGPSWP